MGETRQRSLEGAFGITLHDDGAPGLLPHHAFQLAAAPEAEIQERASLALEHMVGPDIEAVQHLHGHVAVLAGVQPHGANTLRASQGVIYRCQLDDLGARAGNDQDGSGLFIDASHKVPLFPSTYRSAAPGGHCRVAAGVTRRDFHAPLPGFQ